MPSDSELRSDQFVVLPTTPRYLRRNASRAMAGHLLRGLIELITNARDSAYRMIGGGSGNVPRVLPAIEIEYRKGSSGNQIVIRDRFEGMSAAIMQDRLLQYGQTASGYSAGGLVRGMNARGAKDAAVLGTLEYRSICGGEFAECVIREAMYMPPTSRPATSQDRAWLDIASGNGTVATLTLFPDVAMPGFEALARDLEHHIEIRYVPPGAPRVPIVMREFRNGRVRSERDLEGYTPDGSLLLQESISIPEFQRYGGPAELTLYRSPDPLQIGGNAVSRMWKAEAGVMVVDGRTAHDATWLQSRGAEGAAARHLWGILHVPQIPALLLEHEQWEARRERDSTLQANPLNPVQVTDPDRFGLNGEHPFIQLLGERVRPLIEQVLAALQGDFTPSAQERIGAELREALQRIGERLAQAFEASEGSARGTDRIQQHGLSVVPAGLRVELEQTKRIGVYFRSSHVLDTSPKRCTVETRSTAIRLSASEVTLDPVIDQPGLFRGYLEVTGLQLTNDALIGISLDGEAVVARVSVREPTDSTVILDRDLQFSQRRYTSVPGRRKNVEVFADPSLAGESITVECLGPGITLNQTSSQLSLDVERGIAVATFVAESSARAFATLVARCGELQDQAQLSFEPLGSAPRIDFHFTDREDFGPGRRFQWDVDIPDRLLIAAKHPTLARVLGRDVDPQTGKKWPGQHAPQTRAALAELIVEAYVARRLDRELATGSLGYGPENLVDPVEYENFRYRCFDECFLICHEALTPPYE